MCHKLRCHCLNSNCKRRKMCTQRLQRLYAHRCRCGSGSVLFLFAFCPPIPGVARTTTTALVATTMGRATPGWRPCLKVATIAATTISTAAVEAYIMTNVV